ncbi:unnamed protein product [Protopolystoma xenopodis]|uniref:Uncharacterized protein n=1 Tax=Protopolystoma xenopodis TaxID=117903 RepID=A0A3S5AK67_9PLAT|nr:unnamed protein product [Protopolystoma xenopodis]
MKTGIRSTERAVAWIGQAETVAELASRGKKSLLFLPLFLFDRLPSVQSFISRLSGRDFNARLLDGLR